MHYLNEPLSPPSLPVPTLFSPDPEILEFCRITAVFEGSSGRRPDFSSGFGVSQSSASLDTTETSLPEIAVPSYQRVVRDRDRTEWDLAHECLQSLVPIISERRLSRFERCLEQAWFYRNLKTSEVVVLSSACKDRTCPVCSRRRSYDLSTKVTDWLVNHNNVRFATFTLRSSDASLDVQISALYRAFARLRKDRRVRGLLAAGIWFFQCTYNIETNTWHPHIHSLCCGSYVVHSVLAEAWLDASGDSYICDVRFVYDNRRAASYVSRYAARPYCLIELPRNVHQTVVLAFHSRRLFGTWGKLEMRPKIKRRKISLADYECVGSWSYVQALRGIDWRADCIWIAWVSRKPLCDPVSTYSWDQAVDWLGMDVIDIPPQPG